MNDDHEVNSGVCGANQDGGEENGKCGSNSDGVQCDECSW